jgi:methylated-DNA-protein-cysteine methyltransferase-like protein
MANPFSIRVKALIRQIPAGRVCTYGLIASAAGNRRGARQVVRILHAASASDGLPWHRVVNREGRIALPPGRGREEQKALLEAEGVVFDTSERIDFQRFLWRPEAGLQGSAQ